jgi:hypothetical protein
MKPAWLNLLLKVGLFTAIIVLGILILSWLKAGYTSKWIGYMILFFFLVTFSGLALILKKFKEEPGSFVRYFFSVMIARLMLAAVFVSAGLYLNFENRIIFVVNFLTLYLIYLGFEIYYLISNFQSGSGG